MQAVLPFKSVPARLPMELVRVNKDTLGDWARQLKAWCDEEGIEFMES